MGTRLGTLGSRTKCLAEFFRPKKRMQKFPEDVEEIDYEAVFKNHASLKKAYRAVLKKDAGEFDWFFRTLFIESHIYKKLKSIRKVYLVEVAALDNRDKPVIRSKLNSLVEDIDKFYGSLFYFSPAKTLLSIITIMLPIFGLILKFLRPELVLAGSLDLLDFILYPIIVLIIVSFIDKRRFFVFTEAVAPGFFERLIMRLEAFLGRDIKGTICDYENLLFQSL